MEEQNFICTMCQAKVSSEFESSTPGVCQSCQNQYFTEE